MSLLSGLRTAVRGGSLPRRRAASTGTHADTYATPQPPHAGAHLRRELHWTSDGPASRIISTIHAALTRMADSGRVRVLERRATELAVGVGETAEPAIRVTITASDAAKGHIGHLTVHEGARGESSHVDRMLVDALSRLVTSLVQVARPAEREHA